MPSVNDITPFVTDRTGHGLNEDEFITFGSPTAELIGATIGWAITPSAIQQAVAAGDHCIVHHEGLLHPFPTLPDAPQRYFLRCRANAPRLGPFLEHGMTTLRLHGSLDELHIFAADSDVALIETAREVSEDPGLEQFASVFGHLVGVSARFLPTPCLRRMG